jgi:hypothetical protein
VGAGRGGGGWEETRPPRSKVSRGGAVEHDRLDVDGVLFTNRDRRDPPEQCLRRACARCAGPHTASVSRKASTAVTSCSISDIRRPPAPSARAALAALRRRQLLVSVGDKREEDLRQHFLAQLNGHFEGSATGETFNYEGKTDILIRERGRAASSSPSASSGMAPHRLHAPSIRSSGTPRGATGVPSSRRIAGGFLGRLHAAEQGDSRGGAATAPDLGQERRDLTAAATRRAAWRRFGIRSCWNRECLVFIGWLAASLGCSLLPGYGHSHLTFGIGDELAGHVDGDFVQCAGEPVRRWIVGRCWRAGVCAAGVSRYNPATGARRPPPHAAGGSPPCSRRRIVIHRPVAHRGAVRERWAPSSRSRSAWPNRV